MGQPDQALQPIHEALTLARELSEPLGLAHAYFFAAVLHQLRREDRIAREQAEAAIAVSREHGLVLYEMMAITMRGWALMEQGKQDQAIEQMRYGIANRATGTEVLRPHFLGLLAEALAKSGQVDEGLGLLEEALEQVNRSGEGYYEPELNRLKGQMLLMRSRARPAGQALNDAEATAVAEAEACFNQSIKIARHQQAKSMELRTAMSLARLYQNESKREEARLLLSQIYSTFTGGFTTTDLREAKTLLDELS